MTTPVNPAPQKSFLLTAIFAILLGFFGVDRFYLGKVGTGVAKLLTCGGAGVWWLIDVILILAGKTVDKANQPLEGNTKKNRLIAVGILVVILIIGAASPKTTVGAKVSNPESSSSTSDAPAEAPATVGDTLQAADGVTITLNSVKFATKDDLGSAADNGKFLVADYTITNTSGDNLTVSTILSFDASGDSGANYTESIYGPYKTSLDGDIANGRKLTGQIAFVVADESLYYLTFQADLGADKVEFQVTKDQIG